MPATKLRRTPAAVLRVTDAPVDLDPAPFTVTGDMIRLVINSWDDQLVLDPATGAVHQISRGFAGPAGAVPLGTSDELRDCYLAHPTGSVNAYADHLTATLRGEADGGRL